MIPCWQFFKKNRYSRFSFLALVFAATCFVPVNLSAQGRIPVVRDAEIETLLYEYAAPLMRAAGLRHKGIKIVLVNSPSFNAFVDGRRVFVHTGALLQAATPNEIIGVLAHELGHLAGGHQHRLREQLARAETAVAIASILGVGISAASAATGNKGGVGAGAGVAMGGASAARRSLLAYRRGEEMAADQAAVRYLNATKQSSKGMLITFGRFSKNLALSGVRINPYQQSHPLPKERISLLSTLVKKSKYANRTDSKRLQARHDLMRAKIAAYAGGFSAVSRTIGRGKNKTAKLYADAIATHLSGNSRRALQKLAPLIKAQPKNPYFYEIKGEILLRARDAKGAVRAYQKALKFDRHKSSLIKAQLGTALIALGRPKDTKLAVKYLKNALLNDPDNYNAYLPLSQAYARSGDIALADLTQAEFYFRIGDKRRAQSFAARAYSKLRKNSANWKRARDIFNVK